MISWILTLHIIVNLIMLTDGGEQFDVENPNSFQLFENDELCREVFSSELALVAKLKRLRVGLEEHKREVRNAIDGRGDLELSLGSVAEIKQDLGEELTGRFPSVEDFDGALRAMMALQETYNFDPRQLVSDGRIFMPHYARTGTNLSIAGDHRVAIQ